MISCEWCESEFEQDRSTQRYCSRKCRDKHYYVINKKDYSRRDKERKERRLTDPKTFLSLLYTNMQCRVRGHVPHKAHLYEGLEIMSRGDFYNEYLEDERFLSLFKKWEMSGFDTKLTPSPDRLNSMLGYTVDNIDWVTHSVNSRNGSMSKNGIL